jgi:hypothetical protein
MRRHFQVAAEIAEQVIAAPGAIFGSRVSNGKCKKNCNERQSLHVMIKPR